ncbi:MAG: type II toxin-antitoxin system VapC family toxin [Pyrinomonadaceae bacterium]
MSAYFFDSSAIVKRYVNEQGSDWVATTVSQASGSHIYVAAITGVEVVAAFARKRKGNLVDSLVAAAAVSQFYRHFDKQYRVVSVTDPVIARSMQMADTHALRGYDAVQLGAAIEVNNRRLAFGAPVPLTLVTSDTELLAAATAEGLLTDNPNVH